MWGLGNEDPKLFLLCSVRYRKCGGLRRGGLRREQVLLFGVRKAQSSPHNQWPHPPPRSRARGRVRGADVPAFGHGRGADDYLWGRGAAHRQAPRRLARVRRPGRACWEGAPGAGQGGREGDGARTLPHDAKVWRMCVRQLDACAYLRQSAGRSGTFGECVEAVASAV